MSDVIDGVISCVSFLFDISSVKLCILNCNCILLQEGDTVIGSEDASKMPDIGTLYFTSYQATVLSICRVSGRYHVFCTCSMHFGIAYCVAKHMYLYKSNIVVTKTELRIKC